MNGSVKIIRKKIWSPTEFGNIPKKEHRGDFQGETDEPDSPKNKRNKMTWKQSMISGVLWKIQSPSSRSGRQKQDVPQETSFPIPLKYIDVVRQTNTTLDVLQDSPMDDS